MSKTLNYMETGFMVETPRNWHTLHQKVHDILFQGANSEDGRTFVYSVMDDPALGGQCLVSVRANGAVNPELPLEQTQRTFKSGEQMTLSVDISLQRSKMRPRNGETVANQPSVVAPHELEEWITAKMLRVGFACETARWGKVVRRDVAKRGARFFIPTLLFNLKGTISDVEAFSSAWLSGVGRNKGYGLGMLEELQP